MRVYITKYALTQGITIHDAETFSDNSKMVRLAQTEFPTYYQKPDWHFTRQEAINRANVMREKAIARCKSQIKRLSVLIFE